MPIFPIIPADLERLYIACKNGADVAVGSRYVKGGAVENWPANRIALSKGASLYTRMITWMPVKDPTAGFVCYKREVLEAINLDEHQFCRLCLSDRNEICCMEAWVLKLAKYLLLL